VVSNALSRRRKTLKRPIVCKSKRFECGFCQLAMTIIPIDSTPGSTRQITLLLACDPLPQDDQYEVRLRDGGDWQILPNPLTVGIAVDTPWASSVVLGQHTVYCELENSQRCKVRGSVLYTVS
jgi:hypothetical protein